MKVVLYCLQSYALAAYSALLELLCFGGGGKDTLRDGALWAQRDVLRLAHCSMGSATLQRHMRSARGWQHCAATTAQCPTACDNICLPVRVAGLEQNRQFNYGGQRGLRDVSSSSCQRR